MLFVPTWRQAHHWYIYYKSFIVSKAWTAAKDARIPTNPCRNEPYSEKSDHLILTAHCRPNMCDGWPSKKLIAKEQIPTSPKLNPHLNNLLFSAENNDNSNHILIRPGPKQKQLNLPLLLLWIRSSWHYCDIYFKEKHCNSLTVLWVGTPLPSRQTPCKCSFCSEGYKHNSV